MVNTYNFVLDTIQKMFLRKIKSSFIVCNPAKNYAKHALFLSLSTEMSMYLPVEKAPSEPAGFPAFFTARLLAGPICIAPASALCQHTLQSGFTELCSVVVCSGLQLLNWMIFSSLHSSLLLCLCSIPHGAASPTVFPPLMLLPSVVTQSSHITVT